MRPDTETELSEAIRDANSPLCIRGGGTRGMAVAGAALETGGLSGIALYDPGALTMVAAAGTPLAEVEAALEAEGQMLAFEPYDLATVTGANGASTIGGVFATNASGPRRVQVGAARDFLLGVRFVDGSGNVVKNGGRVMKNVTGYDLVKLMAGSHGTLGVLSEVSFKVLPRPETQATLRICGLSDADAQRAMATALGSPFDVSAAMHAPDRIEQGGVTMIRVEGFAGSVSYRATQLAGLLAAFGEVRRSESPVNWTEVRDAWIFRQSGHGGGALWRLGLKPSDAPAVLARVAAAHDITCLYDWGGGLVWVRSDTADIAALHGMLQDQAGTAGGHATLIHTATPLALPRFQPAAAPVARLTTGLRAQFDPRGILNPGLMR